MAMLLLVGGVNCVSCTKALCGFNCKIQWLGCTDSCSDIVAATGNCTQLNSGRLQPRVGLNKRRTDFARSAATRAVLACKQQKPAIAQTQSLYVTTPIKSCLT